MGMVSGRKVKGLMGLLTTRGVRLDCFLTQEDQSASSGALFLNLG